MIMQGVKAAEQGKQLLDNVVSAIEGDGPILPVHEARLHLAIDLLRTSGADPDASARAEALSCIMRPLPTYLRQGRVNAYASARLRLRRTARAR